jgi:hypothetical protein
MVEFKSAHSYSAFAQRIIRRNRYGRDLETDEFLKALLESAKPREYGRLRKDTYFWRAQVGHGWEDLNGPDGEFIDKAPCAFPRERMKPLPGQAREGRANPKGIPCLYGATKRRPLWPRSGRDLGSLSRLLLSKSIRI